MKLTNSTREKIKGVLKKHGIKKAGIFGSYSRGDADQKSDIDILVELPEEKDLLDLVGIKLDIEDLLNKNVDITTYEGLNKKIRDEVLNEELILYE